MPSDARPLAARSVAFVGDLASHGNAPALQTEDCSLTFAELAAMVADRAARWPGTTKRLVLVEIEPSVDAILTYLSALAAGHAVLLATPGHGAELADTWRADDVARRQSDGWSVDHRVAESTHALHPDLALLLSTSGSTGSPKLVRLSRTAVDANAADIAAGLELTGEDRGVTTLPLHYCYGLSVLHAHLTVGACLLLDDRSLTDPLLWNALRDNGITNLAGVPHSFELMAAAGAPTASVPSLRIVTQAGGRLAPAEVSRWAERGAAEGWDLRVMYGQTEATARMAMTGPGQARRDPTTVGRPIGDGRFLVLEGGVEQPIGTAGELHYVGPNVMDGYASHPSDLALGPQVASLDTGDLARLRADGSLEIVGRRSGFLKIAGLRIDVAQIEDRLAASGVRAIVGGDDEGLRVVVEGSPAPAVEQLLTGACGLPRHWISTVEVATLPRLANGKPDRVAAQKAYETAILDRLEFDEPRPDSPVDGVSGADALVALYAEFLDRPEVTAADSFVSLGGDSLSYVELSLRLEERIGELPIDWQRRPIGSLAKTAAPERTAFARVDLTIVLRAVAIIAIVGTHVKLFTILGGSHLLLGVAGYNFARFTAGLDSVRERVRHVGGTIARIAIPTAIWTGTTGALFATYSWHNAAFLNWLLGPDRWGPTWRLWFLEALVWTLVVVVGLLAIKPVRNAYSRNAFGVAFAIACVSSIGRLDVMGLTSPPGRGTLPAVMWLFAIGWAAQVATSHRQRLLLTVLPVALLPGFLDNLAREALVGVGLVALIWVRTVRVPRLVIPVISVLAGASMYIYLTHFDVYRATPWPLLNLALGVGLGLVVWLVAGRLEHLVRHRRRTPVPAPRSKETVR